MKFTYKGKSWYIDGLLAIQLNSIAYNLKKDWDFVIIITGDRTVRTGKSVLAMTICTYLAYVMNRLKIPTDYTGKNIFFDSKKAMSEALSMPKHSIIHYDEGRDALASSKYLAPVQKDMLDYFAECGQLNHVFVIVLPDFFGLSEEISVPRSEFLINVYRKEVKARVNLFKDGEMHPIVKFKRGQFEFFSRSKKASLYDKAKAWKKKNYGLVKANFIGSFVNQYTIDESEYRRKKKDWLKRFKERKKLEKKPEKTDVIRDKIIHELHKEGKSSTEIRDLLKKEYDYECTSRWINILIAKILKQKLKREASAVLEGMEE